MQKHREKLQQDQAQVFLLLIRGLELVQRLLKTRELKLRRFEVVGIEAELYAVIEELNNYKDVGRWLDEG